MRGDLDTVRTLVRQGADVNAAQGDGKTVLHWAAERGDVAIAQLLIAAGGSVTATTRHGPYTPRHVVARGGRGAVVEVLLAAGATAAATTDAGATPLHHATRAGSRAAVEALIAHGAPVDARESAWQQTPLVFAAAFNRADVVRALIAHGADPNAYTRVHDVVHQQTIDQAADAARARVLQTFKVQDGNDPNWRPTPAQVQAAVRAAAAVQRASVVPSGPASRVSFDPNSGEAGGSIAAMQGGLTPLLHAVRQDHVEASLALLEGGADIHLSKRGDGYSPLLMAMINGHYNLGLLLLQEGANPNQAALDGVTPLFAVISNYWGARTRYPQPMARVYQKTSYLETMEALLERGADPDARLREDQWYLVYTFGGLGVDMTGATAFWRAAHAVDVPAMKLLVRYGADPNIPTIATLTAIASAPWNGRGLAVRIRRVSRPSGPVIPACTRCTRRRESPTETATRPTSTCTRPTDGCPR